MTTTIRTPRAAAGAAAALLALAVTAACSGPKPSPEATLAASPTATPVSCPASSSWVSSPSQPNLQVDPSDHCAFYQYAWQSFLYLTSESSGSGSPAVFETWPSVDEVFGSSTTTLAASKRAKLFTAIDPRSKTKKKRFFRQRVNKSHFKLGATDPSLIDPTDTQAGSNGILVDQAGNITYYEQFLDPDEAVPFIKDCTLTISACQSEPGASTLRFPAGSLELKVSWRPLWTTTPNYKSFYLIPGSPVQNASGATVTPDYFGLVGFHLVYTTPGQPEMVWATFEHVDNAPDGPCVSGSACSPPSGFSGWSYNSCTTGGTTSCTNANTWPSPVPSPIPNAQAFLNYPYGTSSSLTDAAGVSGASNISILQALNTSVLGILPAGSVWRNYSLEGAVWTLNGVLPALGAYSSTGQVQPVGSFNVVGSTLLANTTMETFTQFPNPIPSPFPSPQPRQSCFSCHNTASSTSPSFGVSHAMFAGTSGSCSWTTTPPAACTATQPSASTSASAAK